MHHHRAYQTSPNSDTSRRARPKPTLQPMHSGHVTTFVQSKASCITAELHVAYLVHTKNLPTESQENAKKIPISNLGAVRHLGFDRKCFITIFQLPKTHNAPAIRFQYNWAKHGWVIEYLAIFTARFSVGGKSNGYTSEAVDGTAPNTGRIQIAITGACAHKAALWYRYVASFWNDGGAKASVIKLKTRILISHLLSRCQTSWFLPEVDFETHRAAGNHNALVCQSSTPSLSVRLSLML